MIVWCSRNLKATRLLLFLKEKKIFATKWYTKR